MQKIKILTGANGHEKIKEAMKIISESKTDFIRLDFKDFTFLSLNNKMHEAAVNQKYLILDNFTEETMLSLLMIHLCHGRYKLQNKSFEDLEVFERPAMIIIVNTTQPIKKSVADFDDHFEIINIFSPII